MRYPISMLLLALTVLVSIAPGMPVAAQSTAGDEWIVSWDLSYSSIDGANRDNGDRGSWTINSRARGSTRVEVLANRRANIYDFVSMAYQDQRLQIYNSESEHCFMLDDYEMVTDPTFLSGSEFEMSFDGPQQQPDGSWRLMINDTMLRTNMGGYHPSLEYNTFLNWCRGGNYDDVDDDRLDVKALYEFDSFIPYLESVNGDDFFARTSQTRSGQPDQYGNVEVETFSGMLSARRVTCPAGPGPYAGNAAELRDLQLELLPVIDPAPLGASQQQANANLVEHMMVRATCDGKPVQNAPIDVTIEAVEGSGGHNYHEGRPQGVLNGRTISAARPHVTVTTDNSGFAYIKVEPGKDTRSGRLPIAGEYQVHVASVRYPDVQDQMNTAFGYHNLTKLPQLDLVEQVRRDPFGYQDAYNATPATIEAIKDVSGLYTTRQVLHNTGREEAGETLWPIQKLEVNDISLPQGGLFPTIGWDERQGRVTGNPWQPPHYSHLDGTVVDFTLNRAKFAAFDEPAKAYATHRAWIKHFAGSRGQLLSNTTLTYRMRQDLVAATLQSSGPDLSADGFVDRPVPAAAAGQQLPLGLSVANLTENPAAGVSLQLTLPAGMSLVQATPAPSTQNGANLTWQIGDLSAGAVATVLLDVQLANTLTPGATLEPQATVTMTATDPTPEDNTISLPITVQAAGPDLVVNSNLNQLSLSGEHFVTVTLDLENLGNAPAPNSQLRLAFPSPMLVRSEPTTVSTRIAAEMFWSLGELAPDGDKTVSFQLMAVGAGTKPVTFTLSAETSATDIDPANNTQTLVKPVVRRSSDAALSLALPGASDGAVQAGTPLTISLDYANYGAQPASGSVISLTLDPGLRLLSAVPAASSVVGERAATWDLGELAPHANGQIVLRVQVDSLPAAGLAATARFLTTSNEWSGANNADRIVLQARPATPEIPAEVSAPDTAISSGPTGEVTQSTAIFSFNGNGGEGELRFECSLNGTSFSACNSPATYNNLAPGAHTFRVRAVDERGEIDPTPAERRWTIRPAGVQHRIYLPFLTR